MEVAEFERLARKAGLGAQLEHLHAVRRPALEIEVINSKARRVRSRFGGAPDLPRAMNWPEHHLGPYSFTAQIDFAEIAEACGGPESKSFRSLGLPSKGLLSLFHAHDENGEWFWQDAGFVKAWFHAPATVLERRVPPQAVRLGGPKPIRLSPTFDIPANRYQCREWTDDASLWEKHHAFRDSLSGDDHLLGYPTNNTFAYDPSPGRLWSVLLNVRSHRDLGWSWHDGGKLVVFVRTAKLHKADFSDLKSDAG